MSSPSNKLLAIPLLSINSTGFNGAFQLVGKLPQPIRLLRVVNNSNVTVIISFDGSHDHDLIPSDTEFQLPAGALAFSSNYSCAIAANTPVYIKGTAGMGNSGSVSISGYYQPNNP